MSCDSCVSSITHALQRMSGVDTVDVDLARGIAHISGNAQAAPAVLATLAAAGYEAESLSVSTGAKTGHTYHGGVLTGTAHKNGGCYH